MERALKLGEKPWNRSKIMLVGAGRVGKTALCNSLLGEDFKDTESTVGLKLTCNVRTAAAATGARWKEHTKAERVFEAGVAQLMQKASVEDEQIEIEAPINEMNENLENDRIQESIETNNSEEKKEFESLPLQSSPTGDLEAVIFNPPLAFAYDGDKGKDNGEAELFSQSNIDITIEFLNDNVPVLNICNDKDESELSSQLKESFTIEHLSNNECTTNEEQLNHIRESPMLPQIDENILIECLNDRILTSNNIELSIFDFGGQHVFNSIHHLFLTSFGVYVLVFAMIDIFDENKMEQSLIEMSFWIDSIVIHTRNAVTEKMAPVFFVGTHKDKINDPAQHKEISHLIKTRFGYNAVWKYIKEYSDELCFFPVNNLNGQQDDVIVSLMSNIENTLAEADYVKAPRPLTWLKALDELMATKKSFLTLKDASTIALENGVEEDAVTLFLSFLNEMGVVLWLNETGLRNVVILDIITSFVEPATRIICNHTSNTTESTVHHKEIQKHFEKERKLEWDTMTMKGVVVKRLLIEILQFRADVEDVKYDTAAVVNMMLKYGLMVTLEQVQDLATHIEQESNEMYLVPALLPNVAGHPCLFNDKNWIRMDLVKSCYFVFTTNKEFLMNNKVESRALKRHGFLPRGFMQRLIGKAVQWSQLTNIVNIYEDEYLYRNYAHLTYGHQRFRIVCIPEIHCIRLDIEGEHPLPIHDRISEQIDICIKECMGLLDFATYLRLDKFELDDMFTLVSLTAVRDSSLGIYVEGSLLDRKMFSSWVINKDTLRWYDVFISHRWNDNDDVVTKMIYDTLLGYYTVGCKHRALQVFFDSVRLRGGQQFQKGFGGALIKSTVFVPIVCESALQRMLNHNPEEEDNVMIEWMLALECIQDPTHSKVRGIYPLMFGERKDDGSVSPFDASIKNRLPNTKPTKSIEVVKRLLEENSVQQSTLLDSITVRSLFLELSKCLGKWPEEVQSAKKITQEASKQIFDTLCRSGQQVNGNFFLLLFVK